MGDFYLPVHQDVYTAALSLSSKRHPLDLLTIADELTRMGKLDAVGGLVYLGELAQSTVVAAKRRTPRGHSQRQGSAGEAC